MEEDPLRNTSCANLNREESNFGNFATINTCNMRRNNEPQVQNRHVTFNIGSYLNSNSIQHPETRNKPTQFSLMEWFNSFDKRKKMYIAICCFIFFALLVIIVLLISTRKSDQSNSSSSIDKNDSTPEFNPQPSNISCPRAWFRLNGTIGSKTSGGCYHFGSEMKTQIDSYKECQARAGYLVEITNEIEHNYLSQKLQEITSLQSSWNKWWIGLHLNSDGNSKPSDDHEGSGLNAGTGSMDLPENDFFPSDSDWIWKRSEVALSNQIYTGWVESSTDRLEGKCVLIDHVSSWMWKTAPCHQKHFFICEIDAIKF